MTASTSPDLTNQIMMIARVVAAEPDAAAGERRRQLSAPKTLGLGRRRPSSKRQSFSVEGAGREGPQDPGRLGYDQAPKPRSSWPWRRKDGWDKAVAQFNKLYGKQAKADPNDPNVFKLDHRMGVQRISSADLQVLAAQLSNSPGGRASYMNEAQDGKPVRGSPLLADLRPMPTRPRRCP